MFPPGSLLRRNPSLCPPPGVPVIDWSDPINLGLIGLYLPGIAPGNLAGPGALTIGSGSPGYVPTRSGIMASSLLSTGSYLQAPAPMAGQTVGQFTISAWMQAASGETVSVGLGDTTSQSFIIDVDSGGILYVGKYSANENLFRYTGLSPTVPTHILASYNGSLALDTKISTYYNGSIVTSGNISDSGAASFVVPPYVLLLFDPFFNDTPGNGLAGNVRLYSIAKTPADALRLYTDPWAGLIFPRDQVMAQLAAIQAATTLALAQKSWVWLGQGAAPAQAVAVSQRAWSWRPQAPAANPNVALGQKAWRWVANGIQSPQFGASRVIRAFIVSLGRLMGR